MTQQQLRDYIEFTDPGIEVRVTQTEWGSIATLYRQGRSTKWRVWFYENGTARITKPETASLPPVDMEGDEQNIRDQLVRFIQSGWI